MRIAIEQFHYTNFQVYGGTQYEEVNEESSQKDDEKDQREIHHAEDC